MLVADVEDNSQVEEAIAALASPQFCRPQVACNGLVELLALHKVRSHHEVAVGHFLRLLPKHLLDVLNVHFIDVVVGLPQVVHDVGHTGQQAHLVEGKLFNNV